MSIYCISVHRSKKDNSIVGLSPSSMKIVHKPNNVLEEKCTPIGGFTLYYTSQQKATYMEPV